MRRVPTKYLKINSVIATDVYDSNFRLLIKKNSKIDMKTIERLKKFNIFSVYIIDEYSPEFIDDIISSELRLKAVMELKKMSTEFTSIDIKKRYDLVKESYIGNITKIANQIIDELLGKEALLIQQIDIRNMENYNYSHSVNVAVLSIIVAISLKYDRKELEKIALAALLHDIGKALLPKELLINRERNEEEEKLFRSHCELGYNYLSNYCSIDSKIRLAVLHHHEKIDGSGYPRKLKGDQINQISKIISIANFYDNFMASGYMLGENLPSNILEQIMAYVDCSFDYDIVKAFYRKVESFLKGTIVRLNNGEIAIVKGTIEGLPLRPVVKIIRSDNDERVNKCINLAEKLDLMIVEIVYYI